MMLETTARFVGRRAHAFLGRKGGYRRVNVEAPAAVDMLRQAAEVSMAKDKAFIPNALRPWIEARRRFHLSHAHIRMARELGMTPKKFGKLANHRQQPWKAPLPVFIEDLYFRRFGKLKPDDARSIEEIAAAWRAKKPAKREAKDARKAAAGAGLLAESASAEWLDTCDLCIRRASAFGSLRSLEDGDVLLEHVVGELGERHSSLRREGG